MPRSPTDATRFTATGPYMANKQASSSSGSSPPSFSANPAAQPTTTGTRLTFDTSASIPSDESPQQKIARLRAAAALAKRGRESTFDATVRIGRRWADRAHRFTAISLIGLTVLSGAVATAGITDMLLHNRRKRNEWLAGKQAESARELELARTALAEGRPTEDQVLTLNRERARQEADRAKRERPGMYKRATAWAFGDVAAKEESGKGVIERVKAAVPEVETFVPDMPGPILAMEEKAAEVGRTALRPMGGPLDRRAQLIADATSSSAQSWTSWITGRR